MKKIKTIYFSIAGIIIGVIFSLIDAVNQANTLRLSFFDILKANPAPFILSTLLMVVVGGIFGFLVGLAYNYFAKK